jgi:hypothetical protein
MGRVLVNTDGLNKLISKTFVSDDCQMPTQTHATMNSLDEVG